MKIYNYLERAALKWPKEIFLSDENTKLTFSNASQLVIELTIKIRKFGVKEGDRVALQTDRSCMQPILILSIIKFLVKLKQ